MLHLLAIDGYINIAETDSPKKEIREAVKKVFDQVTIEMSSETQWKAD